MEQPQTSYRLGPMSRRKPHADDARGTRKRRKKRSTELLSLSSRLVTSRDCVRLGEAVDAAVTREKRKKRSKYVSSLSLSLCDYLRARDHNRRRRSVDWFPEPVTSAGRPDLPVCR